MNVMDPGVEGGGDATSQLHKHLSLRAATHRNKALGGQQAGGEAWVRFRRVTSEQFLES